MKGRRPDNGGASIVPMRPGGGSGTNLEERAREKVRALEGLIELRQEERETFRRLALPLCHPTRDRLQDVHLLMFRQLVRAVVRYERLSVALEDGETYEAETRNGKQIKSRPEVGQLNETFRQIRAIAGEFGMTPATERAVTGGVQGVLPFDDETGAYLT